MQPWKGSRKMIQEEIKESVIDLLAELFAEQNFDRDILEYIDLIDDAGMDSITFITLVVVIEAKFNVTIPDDMLLMENFKNVDDILRIVENELEGAEKNNG